MTSSTEILNKKSKRDRKNIALASSDNALDKALMILFQYDYHIFTIDLNSQLGSSLADKTIDLLIIDVKSIDKENLKRISLLKKLYSNLPIIMLYDLKIPHHIKSDLFQFADVMFRKPFSNLQLMNAVDNFLKESDAAKT